jgi:hypothetical protein
MSQSASGLALPTLIASVLSPHPTQHTAAADIIITPPHTAAAPHPTHITQQPHHTPHTTQQQRRTSSSPHRTQQPHHTPHTSHSSRSGHHHHTPPPMTCPTHLRKKKSPTKADRHRLAPYSQLAPGITCWVSQGKTYVARRSLDARTSRAMARRTTARCLHTDKPSTIKCAHMDK